MDVRDAQAVRAAVDALRPDAVVNCAANNRVDAAETDPAGAFAVNAGGAARVAAARDVARTIALALPRWLGPGAPVGVYHVVNGGACSWHAFACAALRAAGLRTPVEPIDSARLAAPAPRPRYAAPASWRLGALGLPRLRSWDAALAAYLADAA